MAKLIKDIHPDVPSSLAGPIWMVKWGFEYLRAFPFYRLHRDRGGEQTFLPFLCHQMLDGRGRGLSQGRDLSAG